MNNALAVLLQPSARNKPSNLRLVLLVFEGYLYILGTILIFAGVVGFLAWGVLARHPLIALLSLFLGVPAITLTGAAVRSLMFRIPEPSGVHLTRREAPDLKALIEKVRKTLKAPRIHRVIIGMAFNASAGQVARFVLFWPRNTLVIGYPLLIALSPEQLKAVVAHELAHFAHAHGRIAGWVHRTRLSWTRLAAALNARGAVPILVRWVLTTYVPRLEARSAAMSREQELLADR